MTAGLKTFAKVHALHDSATHPGEKAAAASRMEALARKGSMTVKQAKLKLYTPVSKASAGPSFTDIFDMPFFRQAKADGDRKRAKKWREVMNEHGSEEAVFHPGPWEQALDASHARFRQHSGWDAIPLSQDATGDCGDGRGRLSPLQKGISTTSRGIRRRRRWMPGVHTSADALVRFDLRRSHREVYPADEVRDAQLTLYHAYK